MNSFIKSNRRWLIEQSIKKPTETMQECLDNSQTVAKKITDLKLSTTFTENLQDLAQNDIQYW